MFDFLKKSNKPLKFFYSTDIHSHLVPGVDDGAKNVENSIDLLQNLQSLGITKSIITPHVTQNTFENTPEIINERFAVLQDEIKKNDINIELYHSAEYRVDDFFENNVVNKNCFMPFPNNYILIENSFLEQAMNFLDIVFDLKMKGYTPILAHPERYLYYTQKKSRYTELHNYEILFQINLLSFSGFYGKDVKQTAYWLLDNEMVDFIGTDLHNHFQLDKIKQFMATSEYQKLSEKAKIMNDTAFI